MLNPSCVKEWLEIICLLIHKSWKLRRNVYVSIIMCEEPNYVVTILLLQLNFVLDFLKVWNGCVLHLINHLYTFSASMMTMMMKLDYRRIILDLRVAKKMSFHIHHPLQHPIESQGKLFATLWLRKLNWYLRKEKK